MCNTDCSFEFTSIHYPFNEKNAIRITQDNNIEAYCDYINKHTIDSAEIIMPNLDILKKCPSLKYLKIAPSFDAPPDFDFSPLYEADKILSLNCCNQFGNKEQYLCEIDYSKIKGLIDLFVSVNKGTLNYSKISTLKSLKIGGFIGKQNGIQNMFCSKDIDTIRLIECNIFSLKGIEALSKLQCLYLDYNRTLQDISDLKYVKNSLKLLRIDNCAKIKDFSVLSELENLELLELTGSNSLPDLSFLSSMKNLKTFIFNMNILDGNLSNCLGLSYVYSEKNRKHYNLKDSELPKGTYTRGNEDIETWRRLE